MLSKTNKTDMKPSAKNMLLSETTVTLSNALAALKEKLGEKKFEKRIVKAAKFIIQGVKPVVEKKVTPKKVSLKKAGKTPVAVDSKSVPVKKKSAPKKSA